MPFEVVAAAGIGLVSGSFLNRLIIREPGYRFPDPRDLPEGADEALLDELEEVRDLPPVPVLAVVRPHRAPRRWFPLVELVTAGAFALAAHRYDGVVMVAVAFLLAALVVLAAVDFRVFRIPDRVNFPSMAIGLGLIVLASLVEDLPEAILGALVGGVAFAGLLFVVHLAHPRGMGWGDVKLAWLMGFYAGWLGWSDGSLAYQLTSSLRLVLLAAGIGSLLGALMGIPYAVAKRSVSAPFPYGPSLALGCAGVVLYASALR